MLDATGPAQRAACTIIARNYLAQAQVLASSYLTHHPGHRFFLLVVDGLPDSPRIDSAITALGPEALGLDGFAELAFRYDVTELCTAVKPTLLARLLDAFGLDQVIYLDPDITVFRGLDEIWALLEQATIVVLPHLLDPIPRDGRRPNEEDILISGAYNLGCIAVRASAETRRFLHWWSERLEHLCVVAPARGLFVDQRWIDLVPGLFSRTAILRDPTYDVAYWNLHSRILERMPTRLCVEGRPLAFFHFSGFDPRQRRVLSRYQDRLQVVDESPLATVLDEYADAVQRAGFAVTSSMPYGYSRFDNRQPVSLVHRRLYAALNAHQRTRFGNPFATQRSDSFYAWSIRPSDDLGGLSPFLDRLLAEAPDAQMAFPDPRGRDRQGFLTWARTHGAAAFGFDPAVLGAPAASIHPAPDRQHDDTPSALTASHPRAALRVPTIPPMDLGGSAHGGLGVLAKRVASLLLRYHTHYQGEINVSFANYLGQLQAHTDQLAASVARHEVYFASRPSMTRDAFGTRDLTQPMGYQADSSTDRAASAAPDFVDLFGGSEQSVAERQRAYLPFVQGRTDILNVATGRGEFLDILREVGLAAVGVDNDGAFVERCRQRGLRVEQADPLEYLARLADGSLGAIFSAHFIERIDAGTLAEFLKLAHSRLRPDGRFIAETVNPENHLALKTFHLDLARRQPIYPHALLLACRQAGFASARIFYPGTGGFTQLGYRDAPEYAVIASR